MSIYCMKCAGKRLVQTTRLSIRDSVCLYNVLKLLATELDRMILKAVRGGLCPGGRLDPN